MKGPQPFISFAQFFFLLFTHIIKQLLYQLEKHFSLNCSNVSATDIPRPVRPYPERKKTRRGVPGDCENQQSIEGSAQVENWEQVVDHSVLAARPDPMCGHWSTVFCE